jgi:hypothetical protein
LTEYALKKCAWHNPFFLIGTLKKYYGEAGFSFTALHQSALKVYQKIICAIGRHVELPGGYGDYCARIWFSDLVIQFFDKPISARGVQLR